MIAWRLSILGKCGNRAKAPTRSRIGRESSSSCHNLYGPPGNTASGLIAVSWIRDRASDLMVPKSGASDT